jgi:hypothetical protein
MKMVGGVESASVLPEACPRRSSLQMCPHGRSPCNGDLADETSAASSQASVFGTGLRLVSKARSDFEQNQSALLDLSVSGRLAPAGFRAQSGMD